METTGTTLTNIPFEVDTALADALEHLAKIDTYRASYSRMIDDPRHTGSVQLAGWKVDLERLDAERVPVAAEVADLNSRYTGWSRFFLVRNNGGHIHSSMNCSTCFASTLFGWLPTVSGKTEADAVTEFGPVLCTICFPSAPVEYTGGQLHEVTAARDERAVAKAERDAKKAAKAIEPPVRVEHDVIRTITGARSYLTGSAEWDAIYTARGDAGRHPAYPLDDTLRVVAALAEKTGETPDEIIAAAVKRAAKRTASY